MTRVARVNERSLTIGSSPFGLGGTTAQPAVDDLSDVDLTGIVDGDTLVWDDATDTWIPGAAGSGLFVTKIDGGLETLDAHGSAGATETLDLGDGNWHSLTLTADCTITVTGFTVAMGCSALVKVTQDGTGGWAITWDPDIVFAAGADDQPAQAPGDISWFVLASDEGDGTIYGFPVGGGSGGTPATTVTDETTFGIAPAVGTDTEYARQDHTHGSADVDAVRDAGRWEVAMVPGITAPPEPVETPDGTDWVYGWVT